MTPSLLSPISFRCGAVAPNRVALAPLTNQQSLADGTLSADERRWLERRAEGGFAVTMLVVGIIIGALLFGHRGKACPPAPAPPAAAHG